MAHNFDKKHCQYLHLQKRFKERFGEKIDHSFHDELLKKVYGGRCTLYHKQSNRISILDTNIDINGVSTWIRFVYDNKQKQVVTVYPNDERGFPVEAKFLVKNNEEKT